MGVLITQRRWERGGQMVRWVCETCGAVFPEYVNGCPKCWHGDPPIFPEPQVRSAVMAVEIKEEETAK